MSKFKYTDVFVPGGFPRHTYNPRSELHLENSVSQVLDNLCKLVTVTGQTKSGKTVLVRKILPPEDSVWIDGGIVGEEDDFWNTAIDQLDIFQTDEHSDSHDSSYEFSGTISGSTNIIIAKGGTEIKGSAGSVKRKGGKQSRTVSSRVAALRGLAKFKRPLIVDDFHYLPKNLQGGIVRALKPLIFDGLPVVIIAIPHRRYDAVKVEREMTGRILPVSIPAWGIEELKYIAKTGFGLLNGDLADSTLERLAQESIGSPHLMQDFCRSICRSIDLNDNLSKNPIALKEANLARIFGEIAETIGRPIFEKLARGPRQRSDRIDRKLKSGKIVDIYGLVLLSLARLRPGIISLEYEDLRTAIKDISAQDTPQINEVARVLKHMSEIAASDQSSASVIDFDEEDKRLHVTDPFFSFYLRWGDLESQIARN